MASVFPLSSPLRHKRLRDRLQKWAMPVSSESFRASAFIQANMSTTPDAASVTIAATSPSPSNLGWKAWPCSTSAVEPWAGKGEDALSAIENPIGTRRCTGLMQLECSDKTPYIEAIVTGRKDKG